MENRKESYFRVAFRNGLRDAGISNVIALVAIGLVLFIWHNAVNYPRRAVVAAALLFICIFLYAIAEWIMRRKIIRFILNKVGAPNFMAEPRNLDLRGDAAQTAPIAGASMIIGWTISTTDWGSYEEVVLVLLGAIFSLWCIVTFLDARFPEYPNKDGPRDTTATPKRLGMMCLLFLTHMVAPFVVFSLISLMLLTLDII